MELTIKTSRFSQVIATTFLRLISWRVDVIIPAEPKYILIGAPHTSGWDLLYALLLMHSTGIRMHFIGKDTLFRWPLGVFMRWLGGIPVKRNARGNFVQQIVDIFNRSNELVITIAPEGTREKAEYWRTGFYYIALGAKIPIAMAFVDYENRVVGIGPSFYPSGDIHADFELIKQFYSGIKGRYPHMQGEIKIKDLSAP